MFLRLVGGLSHRLGPGGPKALATLGALAPIAPADYQRGMAPKVELELRKLQWDYYLLTHRLLRTMEQRLLSRFRELGHADMSIARLQVLTLVFQHNEPVTAQQVADSLGLSAVTVGRFVRALEEGGWVRRKASPSDGRALLLEPTRKAQAHLAEFLQISDELFDEAYDGIDGPELSSWVGHLQRIVQGLAPDSE